MKKTRVGSLYLKHFLSLCDKAPPSDMCTPDAWSFTDDVLSSLQLRFWQ